MLEQHNALRAAHHAPALTWDKTLESSAKSWASGCVFAHSDQAPGENLAAGYQSPQDVCYGLGQAERAKYNFNNPGFSHETGHFTQMVWKATKRLGCAEVDCNPLHGAEQTNGRYVVCHYMPRGNIVGGNYFADNVMPQ
ncbi:CAP domain-containing protein [Trichophaea hybrida]|nr:CAP domain-containing protein [Trichophaea hybrida]